MTQKKTLIISEGAPPLGDNLVEGGGLRCWGLACGIALNGHKVTLAYQDVYTIEKITEKVHQNITVKTWNEKNIGEIMSDYDTLIFSYAMGQAPLFIQKAKDNQVVILDCYVPIAIEVAARNSNDIDTEFRNFSNNLREWKYVARRGDYFLCASEQQYNYYLGYLSAINRFNSLTYPDIEKRLLIVPYGIHAADVVTAKPPTTPTLLWYGGFYPWFDIQALADTLLKVKKQIPTFKFLVAGAKNPYNQNEDFKQYYEKSLRSLEKLGNTVEHIEWLPFKDRIDTYAKATAIITANHLGVENRLAWRTRLMDFLGAQRPILTNGGDPLAEDLKARGIVKYIDIHDAESVVKVLKNEKAADKNIFVRALEYYSWQSVTKTLLDAITNGSRLRQPYFEPKRKLKRKLVDAASQPFRVISYIKKNGMASTVNKIRTKIKN